MNRIKARLIGRSPLPALEMASLLIVALQVLQVSGQSVQHLSQAQPGGMPGLPIMTGIERATNGVVLTWDGPSGYYGVFERPGLIGGPWAPLGKMTNVARRVTVKAPPGNGFFRVEGPPPQYAGAQVCAECHTAVHNSEANTRHAGAFTDPAFVADGGQTNTSCLPCHTVGYGLPTGFINPVKTPLMEGVQCESCHGPAATHAANPADPISVPRVEIAATVCGGCHNGSQHPTFQEWQASAHSGVVEDLNSTNQIDACGRCHSGSVRVNLLTGRALPMGDADIGIVCATCHDPHQTNGNPAQLRNPTGSTNDFFLTTSGSFTNQYQPSINVCAQCHNHRGAEWTNSSRAPHHSPQYNILLGTVGELADGLPPHQPAAHALQITNQCVGCHMQTRSFVSAADPAITGHSFKVEVYDLCLNCHPLPQGLVQLATTAVSNQVQFLKGSLDTWATNQAPAGLRGYGTLAWEYTTPGDLSPGGSGPSASEQTLIPVNIQKARFNLYLVLYDGSYGVHNPPHCLNLLNTAQDWVDAELNP